MVCGPIGRGFDPLYLPLIFFHFKNLLIQSSLRVNVNRKKKEYNLNFLLWQEGLLTDFLQKKSANNALQNIVINSFSIFNEKFFFEPLTRFFLLTFLDPLNIFLNLIPKTVTSFLWPMFFTLVLITSFISLLLLSFLI